jgi:hypothetical protein
LSPAKISLPRCRALTVLPLAIPMVSEIVFPGICSVFTTIMILYFRLQFGFQSAFYVQITLLMTLSLWV